MRGAQTQRLLGLLRHNKSLKLKGFALSRTPSGGIVIDRAGHVHGIWDFDGYSYTWMSPGSSEPRFRTDDPKSAALYTLAALTQK
jgi:hypothetical protein